MDKYNWEGIDFPTSKNQWSKFEKQNPSIALNILYIEDEKKIMQAYVSKYNIVRENGVDLLVVQEGSIKHYVAI